MSRDNNQTPHPMPVNLRDTVNWEMPKSLEDNDRFIIRRLVATAYAEGFRDGRLDQLANDSHDRRAERDRAAEAEKNNRAGGTDE